MSATLKPGDAAELSRLVYTIEKKNYTEDELTPYKGNWNFNPDSNSSAIKGSSGTAGLIRKTSGFCTIASGADNVANPYCNHVLILTRGTSSAFDWASDGTVGLSRSRSGHLVHMGFQQVFSEILDNGLRDFFARAKNPVKVHCVGHSLGGALATMIAEWVKTNRKAGEVALYTFGCPRVGMESYRKYAEDKIGKKNIYRVFHQQDPVPMVPLWPFVHLSQDSTLRLGGSGWNFINPWKHSMTSYVPLVSASSNWTKLKDTSWIQPTEKALKQWMESDGVVSFTVSSLNLLNASIAWIFREVFKEMAISIQNTLSVGMTLLDQIAMVLHRAKQGKFPVSAYIIHLIRKILQLLGRKMTVLVEDMSISFIRNIFEELQRRLSKEVNIALINVSKEQ